MTAKELAQMLNGRECGFEITAQEEQIAKDSGLVVVFGYSDNLVEFRGAFHEEEDARFNRATHLTKEGIAKKPCMELGECEYYAKCTKGAKEINAAWHDADAGAAWSYKTDIPHETFNIYEDGELFCIGIVFSVDDM